MVHYPAGSAPLKAGQIQFAEPTGYVNNLNSFKVATRPNKLHWANGRPPVYLSIAQLQRQLYCTGNQPDSRTLIQYLPSDKTKLFFDCECYNQAEVPAADAFRQIDEQVLQPVIAWIAAKTGKHVSTDEMVYEKASRWIQKDGVRVWKSSFHIMVPEIACTARRILDLVEHLELTDTVDRTPYRGES